jgi:hypothetical protein
MIEDKAIEGANHCEVNQFTTDLMLEIGEWIAIASPNRDELLKCINSFVNSYKSNIPRPDILLQCTLPCGGSKDFPTEDAIPSKSVPCPCGNPKHWMIKYTNESKDD